LYRVVLYLVLDVDRVDGAVGVLDGYEVVDCYFFGVGVDFDSCELGGECWGLHCEGWMAHVEYWWHFGYVEVVFLVDLGECDRLIRYAVDHDVFVFDLEVVDGCFYFGGGNFECLMFGVFCCFEYRCVYCVDGFVFCVEFGYGGCVGVIGGDVYFVDVDVVG